jgi:AcrR family transcriptional regulator
VARKYVMRKRRQMVDETRRQIAKATFELHSTVGPACTTMALIAQRAGLPRQTVYRNFSSQLELFRSCIAFGLEKAPIPDPKGWLSIPPGTERIRLGLAELYEWFEAHEPVMTNSLRDAGAVPVIAKAMEPLAKVGRQMHKILSEGAGAEPVPTLMSLAIDFLTWKKLRREEGMPSRAIVEFWADLMACQSTAVPRSRSVRAAD